MPNSTGVNLGEYKQQAFILRYRGIPAKEIVKKLGRYAQNTIEKNFATGGKWDVDYRAFKLRQDRAMEAAARDMFKREVRWAGETMIKLVKKAKKNKDYKLMFEILKEMMDRAGVVVVKKSEVDFGLNERELTDEQLDKLIADSGFNPITGLPLRGTKTPPPED